MIDLLGNLIIAPPAVKGNFWHKAVVMITEHDNSGSVGLTLNKTSRLSVREFGDELGFDLDLQGVVYLGGPLHLKSLSFLHSSEWASTNTMQIDDRYSLSSDANILPRLADGDTPAHWRIILGMCSWAAGQLENEIAGNPPSTKITSWCTAHSNTNLVFNFDSSLQWTSSLEQSATEFAKTALQ